MVTTDGDLFSYDTLVLASGAEPQRPDFDGAGRDDVYLLRTLDDADRLIAAAGKARRAIVLGSSYIGLEAAASLIQRKLEVAVVTPDDVPLGKTAGPEVGGYVRVLHENKGVEFHLGRTVARWDGKTATLDDGTELTGDMIVVGIGVAPRVALAESTGLEICDKDSGGGVKVDHFLQTSEPGIHAIGDIAHYPDPRLGHGIRVEHWVVAQRMGQWLARHLLGLDDAPYRETPFFWSGHYESNIRYVGHVADTADRRIEGDLDEGDFAVDVPRRRRRPGVADLRTRQAGAGSRSTLGWRLGWLWAESTITPCPQARTAHRRNGISIWISAPSRPRPASNLRGIAQRSRDRRPRTSGCIRSQLAYI